MRVLVFTAVAATVCGATSALAQTPTEAPPNPTITQNEANTPSAEQPNDQRKARLPMRREQPLVPDTSGSSGEGASAGTSGSDLPKAPEPAQPSEPQPK